MDLPHNVQPLETPVSPPEKEIQAWGHTVDAYGPLFWNLMYLGHRYLQNIDDETLVVRYRSIVKNFQHLVTTAAYSLPIDSHLSAWYWHRKEYQTRLEFAVRKLELPFNLPSNLPPAVGPLVQDTSMTEKPTLFRYGKSKYMEPLIEAGELRLGPASFYLEGTIGDPRTDDELTRTSYLYGKQTRITTQSGINIPVIGDVKCTISAGNYYLLCMSQASNQGLFDDFACDACVVINDIEEFATRIKNVLPARWVLEHDPVEYFDPYEIGLASLDPLLSKDFSFAYQMEYRFICCSNERIDAKKFCYLKIGNLSDIATMIYRG